MNWESLLLVPVGLLTAIGLLRVLRRMQPPAGVPPLEVHESPGGALSPPPPPFAWPQPTPQPTPTAETYPDVPRWGLMEFVFAVLATLVITSVVAFLLRGSEPDTVDLLFVASLVQVATVALVVVGVRAVRGQDILATLFPQVAWPTVPRRFAILFLLGWPTLVFLVGPLWGLALDVLGAEQEPQELVTLLTESSDPRLWTIAVFSAVVVAPIVEEFAFRGLLYVGARRLLGAPTAIVITGFLFGIVHGNIMAMLPLFVLGMLLAAAYERTRTLAVPILFHAAFNGVSMLLLALAPEWTTRTPPGLLGWLW